jgi:hypothetical protein
VELLAEHARKGEPPVADHVQNLRAEIELMESLLDVDGESRAAVRLRRRRRERFDLVKLPAGRSAYERAGRERRPSSSSATRGSA